MREPTNAERIQEQRVADLIKRRDGFANMIARLTTRREHVPVAMRKEYARLDSIVMVEQMVRFTMAEEYDRNPAGFNRG